MAVRRGALVDGVVEEKRIVGWVSFVALVVVDLVMVEGMAGVRRDRVARVRNIVMSVRRCRDGWVGSGFEV